MLICSENMRLVEGERSGENIFWKQLQTVWGLVYHICLKLADAHILRPPSAYSKLRGFLEISMDCDSWFSSFFFQRFLIYEVCSGMPWHAYTKILLKKQVVSVNAMYIKLIFCVRKRRFSTIDFNNLTSYVSVYYWKCTLPEVIQNTWSSHQKNGF